jgi:hypothetical protein
MKNSLQGQHQVKLLSNYYERLFVFFPSYIIVFMREKHKYVVRSFSLHNGFVPLSFPGKVFNEAVQTQKISHSFSFIRNFSH